MKGSLCKFAPVRVDLSRPAVDSRRTGFTLRPSCVNLWLILVAFLRVLCSSPCPRCLRVWFLRLSEFAPIRVNSRRTGFILRPSCVNLRLILSVVLLFSVLTPCLRASVVKALQSGSQHRLAQSLQAKLDHIQQNGQRAHPDPAPTVMTEEEIN